MIKEKDYIKISKFMTLDDVKMFEMWIDKRKSGQSKGAFIKKLCEEENELSKSFSRRILNLVFLYNAPKIFNCIVDELKGDDVFNYVNFWNFIGKIILQEKEEKLQSWISNPLVREKIKLINNKSGAFVFSHKLLINNAGSSKLFYILFENNIIDDSFVEMVIKECDSMKQQKLNGSYEGTVNFLNVETLNRIEAKRLRDGIETKKDKDVVNSL